MSLSVGPYAQSYPHPGMTHDIYQYQQVRYPEHPDPGYFQNWVLNATQDLPVGQEHHYMSGGTPSPTEYHHHHPHHHHYAQYDPNPHRGGVKRKGTANKKERRRTLSINSAFSNLRGCIPNVPTDTKLSKIKTLRLATSYITYLMDVLSKDDPTLTQAGFKADLSKKSSSHSHNTVNNLTDKHIKKESEGDSDSASSTGSVSGSVCGSSADEKKNNINGRTGWPQHVWASELKQ